MSKAPPVATQADTINDLLDRAKRSFVPIRKSFVQQGSGKVRERGPLGALLTHRDGRALDLYLLVHAAASAEPFDITLSGEVWARAAGLREGPAAPSALSGLSAISKAFRRLEAVRLITRDRDGSRCKVTLLDEAGTGAAYVRPVDKTERYLKLPHEYWTEGWSGQLKLPAKVMLLIALSLDDGFYLPVEKGPPWYGISSDTVSRGFEQLIHDELLAVDISQKKAPLSPQGFTTERHYTLKPPFGPVRAQALAKRRTVKRPEGSL